MSHLEKVSLEDRLRRVERRAGILTVAAAVLGGLVLTAAIQGGGADPQEAEDLRVRSVNVVDAEGRVRAVLGVDADGPALHLIDDSGVRRASLVDRTDETGLFLQDAAGDTRVGAAHFAHGGSGYALHGPGGEGALVLYLEETGTLSHYGPGGEVLARFP